MAVFRRNTIVNSGLSGLSEKYINDNFMSLFSKVSNGNINYADMDNDVKTKLSKQWIPFQADGNLDANFPLYARFYCPPNVKSITSAKVSAILTKYRMDSGVANSMPVSVTANLDINTSSVSIGIANNTNDGGSVTRPVEKWGTDQATGGVVAPGSPLQADTVTAVGGITLNGELVMYLRDKYNSDTLGYATTEASGSMFPIVDYFPLQHTHRIPAHAHYFAGTSSPHSHTGSANFQLPTHTHPLNEGIKVSSIVPQNAKLLINGSQIGNAMNGDGTLQNDIDFLSHVNIGAWNTIEVVADTVARISIYGVLELILEYSKDV